MWPSLPGQDMGGFNEIIHDTNYSLSENKFPEVQKIPLLHLTDVFAPEFHLTLASTARRDT